MPSLTLGPAGWDMFMQGDAWKWDSESKRCVLNPKCVLKGSQVQCRGVGEGSVSWLTLLFSPRASKDKWNSPNGLEEKEVWSEEDQLFEVRGKASCRCSLKCEACYLTVGFMLQKPLPPGETVALPDLIWNH